VSDWLSTIDPHWLLPLISLVSLLESLAIVGLIVPGVALLAALCWLAGSAGLSIPWLLLGGFFGAVLGDWISFRLGRHALPWLKQRPLLQRHPQWLPKGEAFFQRYGGSSVLLGRFIGPLRPVIPLVAGSLKMPSERFLMFNLLSAFFWAPVYLLPGYWLGQQSAAMSYGWNIWSQLGAAGALIIVLLHAIHPRLDQGPRLQRWLPFNGSHNAQLLALLSATGFALLLSYRAIDPLPQWEIALSAQLQAVPAGIHQLMVAVTLGGDLVLILSMTAALGISLLLLRRIPEAILSTSTLLLAVALNIALKHLYALPRPELGQMIYSSYSFPSGHASAAAAFWAVLAVLFSYGRPPRQRRIAYSLALVPLLLIALSRVVLGVHWPLDALAGLMEGLLLAALMRWLWQHYQCRPLLGIQGSVLLIPVLIWLFWLGYNLDSALAFYNPAALPADATSSP